jgi:cytoskeleton protein RodZ
MRPGTAASMSTVVKKAATEVSRSLPTLQPEMSREAAQGTERTPVLQPASPAAPVQAAPPARAEVAASAPVAPVPARPASAVPSAVAEPVAPGSKTLRFSFSDASWVEIKDARGRTLISKINPKGSQAEVVGKPPFTVWIGNAPEVQFHYNDKEFDLAPHTRSAVARFTLD